MIQVRPYRLTEFIQAKIHIGSCDERLLNECAYYPRPATFFADSSCLKCSWDQPNKKCKYAHILVDTRLGENRRT
jgi:hypothetical protein